MKMTIIATLMIFLAYFLVLYGGVGFIQDKRFFVSAPKENLDAIPDKKERFRGAHVIGWAIEGVAVLLFLAAAALSRWDGVKNSFSFLDFFTRFFLTLYAMEIYDVVFFDWVLAVPLRLFPSFLSGDEGNSRSTYVRVQQKGAYQALCGLYSRLRRSGVAVCASLSERGGKKCAYFETACRGRRLGQAKRRSRIARLQCGFFGILGRRMPYALASCCQRTRR